jgi:pimeloyl-ACP methyl ester carboxylesterase
MKLVQTQSQDGIYFKGLLSEPDLSTNRIIVHIHGMAGSPILNDFYQQMHEYYPKNGYAFLAGENRGSGILTDFASVAGECVVGNAFERFEDSVLDIQAWIDFANKIGYSEVWLQGHSLGCSKIAYYHSQNSKTKINGLILISPSDMLGLVHEPQNYQTHTHMLQEAVDLIARNQGDQLLTHKLWGVLLLSAHTYSNFFSKDAKTGIFNFFDQSLGWDVVTKIDVPVLAMTGTDDDGIVPCINPQSAMNLLERKMYLSNKIKTIVYKNATHEFYGFGNQIVKDVIAFL